MTATTFHPDGPPLEVFANLSEADVREAYEWAYGPGDPVPPMAMFTALLPAEITPQQRQEIQRQYSEIAQRCASHPVLAWLACNTLAGAIAHRYGPAPEGHEWWTIPRIAYPQPEVIEDTAREMRGAAEKALRAVTNDPAESIDLSDAARVLLRQARITAEKILNDVCAGQRPGQIEDIGIRPVLWVMRALALVRVTAVALVPMPTPPDYEAGDGLDETAP